MTEFPPLFPPGWMIEVAGVALPDPVDDPERDVAAGMARLLYGLATEVGRSGIAMIRPEELLSLSVLLDPLPRPRRPREAAAEVCTECRVLDGHRDDCPTLHRCECGGPR